MVLPVTLSVLAIVVEPLMVVVAKVVRPPTDRLPVTVEVPAVRELIVP